jgi:hypothetical protein
MRLSRLWLLAALIGALGAVILFDRTPGLNVLLWTGATITGLLLVSRHHQTARVARTAYLPLGFALLLAAGSAVTAIPLFHAGIVALVACLLALATLLIAQQPSTERYGATYIVGAPLRALGKTVAGTIRTLVASLDTLAGTRMHPAIRGGLIAIPFALVFALLFATADPVFARGRDAVASVFTAWEFSPRVLFGVLLMLFVLGAYAVAARGDALRAARADGAATSPVSNIGVPERIIVLYSVAGVFWLFVLLQLSYMFTAAPALAGSGTTFAEYARRGFGELAVAATTAVLLIIATRRFGTSDARGVRTVFSLRTAALVLLAAVVCVLASALHRVSLYESAYGFTTRRVYAQAYMAMTLVILVIVTTHVLGRFDAARLARQIMTVSLTAFAVLVYWNGDAWVASRNLDRFVRTGKIDVLYLTRGLAPDAYPTLVRATHTLPAPTALQLHSALLREASRTLDRPDRWFEWNLRRTSARHALYTLRGDAPTVSTSDPELTANGWSVQNTN